MKGDALMMCSKLLFIHVLIFLPKMLRWVTLEVSMKICWIPNSSILSEIVHGEKKYALYLVIGIATFHFVNYAKSVWLSGTAMTPLMHTTTIIMIDTFLSSLFFFFFFKYYFYQFFQVLWSNFDGIHHKQTAQTPNEQL